MWAALISRFARQAGVPIIGVTGTRGKTTTTAMIAAVLTHAGKRVITGGNVKGTSMLPALAELSKESFAVLELDSWKLQGFREEGISPNVSVFTIFLPDHQDYYGNLEDYLHDKAAIFLNQEPDDVLIVGEQAAPLLKQAYGANIASRVVIAKAGAVPEDWQLAVPGDHNRANAACAMEALRVLGIDDETIGEGLAAFGGVPGRLELLREVSGVRIYNDTTATTPDATIAALRALDPGGKRTIILIMGGADKGLSMEALVPEIAAHAKTTILLAGTGTDRIRQLLPDAPLFEALRPAVEAAVAGAGAGDTIVLSPAFASFGMFTNEYDRGDQFRTLIDALG
jgi:UDP-N-acetylmuramoylalanine--D-glutamate ligase